MAFTKADVAPRNINGELVELSEAEKQAIVDEWNAPEPEPTAEELQAQADKESANQKLRDLGLTDAEIEALKS